MAFANFLYPKGFYVEESNNEYAKIIVPQLEKGYGITIGNMLRRILISSIEGYSVVAVYIQGAVHEFSTIEGIVEDVPYILLNIRKIKFKVDENLLSLPAKVIIEFEGPGEITAENIQLPTGIEVINKQQYIATVTTKKNVYIEIFIDKGIGFVPREDYPEEYRDLFSFGTIFVDGNFSPIEKVNWTVEKTRYEAYMDKDRLVLEIWTNGTISPITAYYKALDILEKHLIALKNEFRKVEEYEYVDFEELGKRIEQAKKKQITDLGLSPKILELLKSKGIKKLEDLIVYTEEEVGDWFVEAGIPETLFEELKNKVYSFSLEFSKKARG